MGKQLVLNSLDQEERITAWDLAIKDDFDLKPGYSGAPVIDTKRGYVLGIASDRFSGEKGVAIAIKTLVRVWSDMPSGLIRTSPALQGTEGPARKKRIRGIAERNLPYLVNREEQLTA